MVTSGGYTYHGVRWGMCKFVKCTLETNIACVLINNQMDIQVLKNISEIKSPFDEVNR